MWVFLTCLIYFHQILNIFFVLFLVLTRLASFKCSSANHKVFDISFIISANCDTILLYCVSQRGRDRKIKRSYNENVTCINDTQGDNPVCCCVATLHRLSLSFSLSPSHTCSERTQLACNHVWQYCCQKELFVIALPRPVPIYVCQH